MTTSTKWTVTLVDDQGTTYERKYDGVTRNFAVSDFLRIVQADGTKVVTWSAHGSNGPLGYTRVQPNLAELTEWRMTHNRPPSVYRVQCDACGKRMWGSGIGIGSHNKACKGTNLARFNSVSSKYVTQPGDIVKTPVHYEHTRSE